ncbi:MAG: amidohydrolase family protein, partial [Euryarchaeota archaeon]|nr:amidohydrolase family protein [Euryarchaeota archaeon]
METVVEGRAYYQGKLVQCCIGIENGKIAAIKKILKGDEHHDFGDSVILPAAVDVHVHFRDPGLTKKEDFQSGTVSAAFGGVSCVLDMPNTLPPAISAEAVREKLASASKKAWVDFGLFGGCASSKDPSQIARSVAAFKIFMSSATGKLLLPGEREIAQTLSSIAPTGKVVSVHAEEEGMIRKAREESLLDHDRNRPVEAEVAAIKMLSRIDAGARVH